MEADGNSGVPGDWGADGPNIDQLLVSTPLAGAEFHASLATSQARAKECLAAGVALPYLILANAMPAAYGRQGRAWWAGPGCISMSLLWTPDHGADADLAATGATLGGLLSLASAIAVIDTAAAMSGGQLMPGRDLTLHWPNDVYLQGRKLSGILAERVASSNPPGGAFAVGIGINVNNRVAQAPAELQSHIMSLRDELGGPLPRQTMLIEFLRRYFTLAGLATQQVSSENPESTDAQRQLVSRANELCVQVGRQTAVLTGRETFTGSCLGIDARGGLVLETADGPRTFLSGEIQTTKMP